MASLFRQDVCSSATVPAQQISASDIGIVIDSIQTDANFARVNYTLDNPYDEDVDVTVDTEDDFGTIRTKTTQVPAGSTASDSVDFAYDFTSDTDVQYCCTVVDAQSASGGGGGTSMIADFESGSLGSGWTGDTGSFAVSSAVVIDGSYSLEGTGYAFIRNSNLSAPRGNSYSEKVYFANSVEPNAAGPMFCTPGYGDGYAIEALQPGGGLRITRVDGGDPTFLGSSFPLSSLPTGEPLTIEWTVTSSDITADLYDSTGSNLASTGATDSTYTTDVPGIYNNSAGTVYHDSYQQL